VNERDLDRLGSCFAEDYRNETPAHPLRGFTGRQQVLTNWGAMFAGIADLSAELVDAARHGEDVWAELLMTGRRPDGSPHELAGVCIFRIWHGEIASARFYLEPVERASGDVDDAVRRQMQGRPS
jgi:hypothetical protein